MSFAGQIMRLVRGRPGRRGRHDAYDAHRGAVPGSKQRWILAHLRCSVCRRDSVLKQYEDHLACRQCNTRFELGKQINMLTPELKAQYLLVDTARVSNHAYNAEIQVLIDETGQRGGVVLDAGSGSRPVSLEHLVQLDIKPYGNVDVLGANQSLPFCDTSFDGVISLDVLEHVDDPFLSAREIVRVLKPGGWLYVDVPFMQHEHGYPHHYFNMTRMGLRRLFADAMEFERHWVPDPGHPIFALYSTLVNYHRGLRAETRERFRGMTIGEFLEREPRSWRNDPLFDHFDDEKKWIMAATTRAVLRKKPAA